MKKLLNYYVPKTILTTLIISVYFSVNAQAQSRTSTDFIRQPWFAQLQYAGNMGQFSLGAGKYFFQNKFLLSMHYGETPPRNEGATTARSFTLKNTFIPTRIILAKKYYTAPEFGWAISYSGNFPIPLLMFFGARIEREFEHSAITSLGLFFHVGTNSFWLSYAADNSDIEIEYLYNLSTGLQVNF